MNETGLRGLVDRIESYSSSNQVPTLLEYLELARDVVRHIKRNPDVREELGMRMSSVWLMHEGALAGIDDIGGEFAELELPAEHVNTAGHKSVKDKINTLEQAISTRLAFVLRESDR